MIALRYILVLGCLIVVYLAPAFLGNSSNDLELHILAQLKVPIALTAIFVGASIALASAALQVSLNNPLADPGIIGVSSGASATAAFFIIGISSVGVIPSELFAQYSMYTMPALCFVGACLSGLLIYVVAKRLGSSLSSFILAGIAISTVFSALVGWMYLVAPANALQSLTFWLMGSLQYTNYNSLAVVLPIMCVAIYLLYSKALTLNLLYLGSTNAQIAGVDTKRTQTQTFVLVALLIGLSVSVAGSIAFLGLLVPHAVRRLHGFDNRHVFLYSALLGAIVLMLCVNINTYLFTSAVPLSMLTASIGAPFFIYALFSRRQSST